jgi:phage FluMu protein Com
MRLFQGDLHEKVLNDKMVNMMNDPTHAKTYITKSAVMGT